MMKELDRHTIEVQDEIINDLREDNERLRELLKKCVPYIAGWPEARELFSEIQKELGDE